MKKTRVTRVMAATLLALLLVLPLAGACARPAPAPAPAPKPTPTAAPAPAPKPAPAPAPKPTPAPAPAPKANSLDEVIAGAKREGEVSVSLASDHAKPASVAQMRKEIKEMYGVDLKITAMYSASQGAVLAEATMQHKTGAVPTFDLMTLSPNYIPEALKAGAVAPVDWRPLVSAGTNPAVIPQHPALRGAISYYSMLYGVMYNPNKVSAAELPKKFSDLADPKWKGRLGLFNYPIYWIPWAFVLGKDNFDSTLRSIIKNNKPVLGIYADVNNRYLLEEIDLGMMTPSYLIANREKGIPSEFVNLDFVNTGEVTLAVHSDAAHPNAARLVAIYLTSPAGVKFGTKYGMRDSAHYPGNYLSDIKQQGIKDGKKVVGFETTKELLDFFLTPELGKWLDSINLILKGG
ncbi:MAG: extracellular solute-binding protein [Chloroflexi bacterium]|nr:extracellular solute-binding protein [Chloroflexota bacterium]